MSSRSTYTLLYFFLVWGISSLIGLEDAVAMMILSVFLSSFFFIILLGSLGWIRSFELAGVSWEYEKISSFYSTDCLKHPNCNKNSDNQRPKDEREECNGEPCHWEHVFGKSILDLEIPVHTLRSIYCQLSSYRVTRQERGIRLKQSPLTKPWCKKRKK